MRRVLLLTLLVGLVSTAGLRATGCPSGFRSTIRGNGLRLGHGPSNGVCAVASDPPPGEPYARPPMSMVPPVPPPGYTPAPRGANVAAESAGARAGQPVRASDGSRGTGGPHVQRKLRRRLCRRLLHPAASRRSSPGRRWSARRSSSWALTRSRRQTPSRPWSAIRPSPPRPTRRPTSRSL